MIETHVRGLGNHPETICVQDSHLSRMHARWSKDELDRIHYTDHRGQMKSLADISVSEKQDQQLATAAIGTFADDAKSIDPTNVDDVVTTDSRWQKEHYGLAPRLDEHSHTINQSEKLAALGTLLAGIAHELNNPLSVVSAQALLMKDTVSDPKLMRRAEKIANAADRCSRIVRTFLAMARQRPLSRSPVIVNDIVKSVVDVTRYSLRTNRIELELSLAEDIPPVWADMDELNQVITNLIVNAQQALSVRAHSRHLHVSSAYDTNQDRVLLSVSDNGPGIPSEIRSRIFEPLFTTKDVGKGTGIGLAICHRIIESLQGEITVTSQVGRGTCFTISLPASSSGRLATPKPVHTLSRIPHCKLLLIESEADVAQMLREILESDGHEVRVARSGDRALQLLARHEFDLILSDLGMPDLDGFRLYEMLCDLSPRLRHRVGFITGDTFHTSTSDFLRQADRPYIEKPFTPNQVRTLIREILSHVRLSELLKLA